jgi:hypothetical protein
MRFELAVATTWSETSDGVIPVKDAHPCRGINQCNVLDSACESCLRTAERVEGPWLLVLSVEVAHLAAQTWWAQVGSNHRLLATGFSLVRRAQLAARHRQKAPNEPLTCVDSSGKKSGVA